MANRAVVASDYSVFIPVCLPWGIILSGSEAPEKKSAESVPRHDASHMQSTRLAIGLQAGVARSEHVCMWRLRSAPLLGC